jgi:hypothetical protein
MPEMEEQTSKKGRFLAIFSSTKKSLASGETREGYREKDSSLRSE